MNYTMKEGRMNERALNYSGTVAFRDFSNRPRHTAAKVKFDRRIFERWFQIALIYSSEPFSKHVFMLKLVTR